MCVYMIEYDIRTVLIARVYVYVCSSVSVTVFIICKLIVANNFRRLRDHKMILQIMTCD